MSIENSKLAVKRERIKMAGQYRLELRYNYKKCDIHIMGMPRGEESKGKKKYLE